MYSVYSIASASLLPSCSRSALAMRFDALRVAVTLSRYSHFSFPSLSIATCDPRHSDAKGSRGTSPSSHSFQWFRVHSTPVGLGDARPSLRHTAAAPPHRHAAIAATPAYNPTRTRVDRWLSVDAPATITRRANRTPRAIRTPPARRAHPSASTATASPTTATQRATASNGTRAYAAVYRRALAAVRSERSHRAAHRRG
jgi:hypothetical protein